MPELKSRTAPALPRSLMREASRRAAELTQRRRLRDQVAVLARPIERGDTAWALAIYIILAAPLFLPLSWHLSALRTNASATDFVGTAWQVKAAVVALSLAVVLFAFESARGSRWGMSLREFAQQSHLLVYMHLGMASLLVDWLVLLHLGTDAPAGWAGTWSAILSAATIVSIPLLFATSLRGLDTATLRAGVQRKIIRAVGASVDQDIRERVALNLLVEYCDALNIGFSPIFQRHGRPGEAVRSLRTGIISDINIKTLAEISLELQKQGHDSPVQLLCYVGRAVNHADVLLQLPTSASSKLVAKARQCIAVRTEEATSAIEDALQQLRQGALSAVSEGQQEQYQHWNSLYRDLLLAYPRAWAAYGARFDAGAASGLLPFGLSALDRVVDDLEEVFRLALVNGQREVANQAGYLPVNIAMSAIPLGAHGLTTSLLNAVVRMQSFEREVPTSVAAQDVCHGLRDSLFAFIDYGAAPRIEDESLSIAERVDAGEFVEEAFSVARELIKHRIDAGARADVERLVERWAEVLRHFDPDADHARWEYQFAVQRGASLAEIEGARRSAEQAEALATIRQKLDTARSRSFFELASWTLRDLDRNASAHAEQLVAFLLNRIGGAHDRVSAAGATLEHDAALSNWILFSLPARQAHMIGTDSLVMRALAISLMVVASDAGEALALPPDEWLSQRAKEIKSALDGYSDGWAHWSVIIPGANVVQRRISVRSGLDDAVAAYEKRARHLLVDSAPLPERVTWFLDEVRRGVADSRLADVVAGGAVEVHEDAMAEPQIRAGRHEWIPKEWFLPDCRVVNVDDVAREFGSAVGRGETEVLFATLRTAPELGAAIGEITSDVTHAAEELRANSFTPTLIVGPTAFRVWRELGLEHSNEKIELPHGIGEGMRHWVQGRLGEILVIAWPGWPEDFLVVADLPSFLELQRLVAGSNEPDALTVTLGFYDAERARELAEANDEVFRTAERTSIEARAEEVQTQATLRVSRVVATKIKHEDAALRVPIAAKIRDDAP